MENSEVNTRLMINLREGVIEAEGDEEFVRTVYEDFKERMSKTAAPSQLAPMPPQLLRAPDEVPNDDGVGNAKKAVPRKASKEGKRSGASTYKPKFNSKLDVAGVDDFYSQFLPANHSEKILIFGVYLRDKLGMNQFSADDIFTCYFALKEKTEVPEAFWQAFITTKNRTHFIEYESPEKIEITIPGDNHFSRKLKRAASSTPQE